MSIVANDPVCVRCNRSLCDCPKECDGLHRGRPCGDAWCYVLAGPPAPHVLLCPFCGKQHVDADEWATKPHRTHLCHFCGKTWRPHPFSTRGVEYKDAVSELHHRAGLGPSYVKDGLDPKPGEGAKYDRDKPRWGLLPMEALAHVVDVLTYGAKKYAPENWRKVQGWDWRYMDATFRHLAAYVRGEKLDPETGLPHLAHAVCCLLFMLALDKR